MAAALLPRIQRRRQEQGSFSDVRVGRAKGGNLGAVIRIHDCFYQACYDGLSSQE